MRSASGILFPLGVELIRRVTHDHIADIIERRVYVELDIGKLGTQARNLGAWRHARNLAAPEVVTTEHQLVLSQNGLRGNHALQLGLIEVVLEVHFVFFDAELFGGPIDILLADGHLGRPRIAGNIRVCWRFYLAFVFHMTLSLTVTVKFGALEPARTAICRGKSKVGAVQK